jgi:hypothetical protein
MVDPMYAICLLVGAVLGRVVRRFVEPAQADRMYGTVSDFIVLVLLPLHVFLATARAKQLQQEHNLWPLMLWGAAFSAATFVAIYLICRAFKPLQSKSPHLAFIGSTFSGGGRTTLLAALLAPLADRLGLAVLLGSRNTLIDALAIFDVGYWIFYVLAMQLAMRQSYPPVAAPAQSAFKWLGVGVAMGLAIFGLEWFGAGLVEQALTHRTLLTNAIVVLAAFTFMLKLDVRADLGVWGDIAILLAGRIAVLVGLYVLLKQAAPHWLILVLLPAALMALSPPSSLVDKMLHGAGAPESAVQNAIDIGVILNLILLIVLSAATVIGMVLSEAASWPPPAP